MILCLGTTPTVQRSMIFDRLKIGDVNRATEAVEYASGKSPNVARVVHELRHEVVETGFIGGDRGKFLREDLQRAGIRCEFVEVAAQTRLCTTVIDRATAEATELIEESRAVEAAAWEKLYRKLEEFRAAASVVVCSGSLTPRAPRGFYEQQVIRKRPGQRVIVDGRGEPARCALRQGDFILKLNLDELAATVEMPMEDERQRRAAMESATPRGGWIIVTMGAEGAMVSDGKSMWRVKPPRVKTVSAIGSGDAFAAGLAVGMERGMEFPDCCKLASACGAANAMTSLAGHVKREEVEKLVGEVRVSET